MFELTRFISAIGAVDTFLAQLKADTFSGNSDRKGATHCTNTKVERPSPTASAFKLSRKGGAVKYKATPPIRKRPTMRELRVAGFCARIACGILSMSSIFSSSCGGIFLRKNK